MTPSIRIVGIPLVCASIVSLAPAQAPTIRDSAGIRIVENPSRLKAPIAFRVPDKPTLELGGTSDTRFEVRFFPLALRLSDGRIAVADNGYLDRPTMPDELRAPDRAQVKYFDAVGKLLQTVTLWSGDTGQFKSIGSWCRIAGDTILLGGPGGIGVLDPRGKLVRVIRSVRAVSGCMRDGSVLANEGDLVGRGADATRHLIAVDGNGSPVHDFGMVPIQRRLGAGDDEMVVHGGKIAEYRVVSDAGKLVRIVRTDDQPQAVSAEETAAMRARPRAPNVVYISDVLGPPTSNPVYENLLVDSLGRTWLQDYEHSEITHTRGNTWTAFDARGAVIGRLKLPTSTTAEQWEVVSFSANEVIIRHRAKDEVHLLFYPLLPVSSPRP